MRNVVCHVHALVGCTAAAHASQEEQGRPARPPHPGSPKVAAGSQSDVPRSNGRAARDDAYPASKQGTPHWNRGHRAPAQGDCLVLPHGGMQRGITRCRGQAGPQPGPGGRGKCHGRRQHAGRGGQPANSQATVARSLSHITPASANDPGSWAGVSGLGIPKHPAWRVNPLELKGAQVRQRWFQVRVELLGHHQAPAQLSAQALQA